jgi:hypothetical protein
MKNHQPYLCVFKIRWFYPFFGINPQTLDISENPTYKKLYLSAVLEKHRSKAFVLLD